MNHDLNLADTTPRRSSSLVLHQPVYYKSFLDLPRQESWPNLPRGGISLHGRGSFKGRAFDRHSTSITCTLTDYVRLSPYRNPYPWKLRILVSVLCASHTRYQCHATHESDTKRSSRSSRGRSTFPSFPKKILWKFRRHERA